MMRLRPTASPILTSLALLAMCVLAHATPSTLVWIPSTDIQGANTWHFGVDNYFKSDITRVAPTDIGLTYGLPGGRAEVGFDYFAPSDDPLTFNGKYLICPESGERPAIAVGGYFFGAKSGVTDANVVYILGSKTFDKVRVHLGYAHGKASTIGGTPDMLLAGLDGYLDAAQKWWWGADYQSGDSALGALNFGVAYSLNSSTSVLVGYDFYNNSALDDSITVQLDVNF